jgi:hypothetical protein
MHDLYDQSHLLTNAHNGIQTVCQCVLCFVLVQYNAPPGMLTHQHAEQDPLHRTG